MTDKASVETSQQAPQTKADKPLKLNTQQAADIFKNSILASDTAKGDKSKDKEQTPAKKTTKTEPAPKSKDQSKQVEANEDQDEEAKSKAASEEDEEQEDESQSEDDDQAEDEAEGGDTDEADDVEDGEDLHTVVVDGEEKQIPYEELVLGYQRQADYTKKTIELANERKALQAEKAQVADLPRVKEFFQQQGTRFENNAGLVLAAFEKGFMPAVPNEELRKTNPSEYLLQKEKHQEALQFVGGLKKELDTMKHAQFEEQRRLVGEGRTKLLQVEPELQKPEIRGKLQNYIVGLGYTADQMKNEPDHRLFQLALKAMKYDDLVARSKNPAPEKKRHKVMKQTNSRDDADTVAQKKNNETLKNHKKNHNTKSASAVFEQKLRNMKNKR